MNDLYDFDNPTGPRPVLLPVQLDLLERGRVPYSQGARRVIWQAPCGAGKTWIAAEQTCRALANGKTVLHIVHRRRLVDQMLGTLKRFGVTAAPIMEGRQAWDAPVKCASRDTLVAMLKSGCRLPTADLLVWDECHVAAELVQKWYENETPGAFWTGYTATPVRPAGDSLAPPYEALVCMAPTSEMIRLGRLVPVKVYNPDAVGRRRRQGEKVKPVGDPVQHWRKYANDLPTVVFAAKVSDSLAIVQRYRASGVTAEHLDADTPEAVREAMFERSRAGETKVLSNVGVLVEGVDLPWLRCCQILRGCNSLVLWLQAAGRIMRAYPDKPFGILLDHAGAAHEFGLPDGDFTWSLEDESANVRKNKPPKDRKPATCPACGAVFVGKPACPECGKVLSVRKRRSLLQEATDDGLLTRYSGEQADALRADTLNRLWRKCLHIGRAKGWAMRQVAGVFSREARVPPWEAGLDAELPGRHEWSIPASDWLQRVAS
jgi:DNA repair protein RadD